MATRKQDAKDQTRGQPKDDGQVASQGFGRIGRQAFEPGTRVEHEGRWAEVVDTYGKGHRLRYDDGTEVVVE